MRITVTEIEATAEELRQSNTLADNFNRILRNAFNPYYGHIDFSDISNKDEEENE